MPKRQIVTTMVVLAVLGTGAILACTPLQLQADLAELGSTEFDGERIMLPEVLYTSDTSVEQALLERRSIRRYQDQALAVGELSQLLWAAQGITHPDGLRTAPSAGALYPLEVYVVVGNVEELAAGIYRYEPRSHELVQISTGDKRSLLGQAALGQEAVGDAAAVIALAAVYDRTTVKYGDRGIRYVYMEVGAAAQNIYLQAASLGLGTVFIGAFHDEQVKEVLALDDEEEPLCLMPVGRP